MLDDLALADLIVALFAVLCFLILWRNERVYRFRLALIWSDEEAFNRLPSYDAMMLRFWVWPLRRFLKEQH